jgi:hypothetical protein
MVGIPPRRRSRQDSKPFGASAMNGAGDSRSALLPAQ